MNARDTIRKHLAVVFGDPDGATEELLAALKAEGLFVGPLVATDDMMRCRDICLEHFQTNRICWADMVEEWQRTEGA